MISKPSDSKILGRHIDYYWIVRDSAEVFAAQKCLNAYPGITPDLMLVLDGSYEFTYLGNTHHINESRLYSFLHGKACLELSNLNSFILIKFKTRGLSSLLPFVDKTSQELMQSPIISLEALFGKRIKHLEKHLCYLSDNQIVNELDELFSSIYKQEREGFMVDIAEEVSESFNLKEILDTTKYSYSTLERHFKRDTGLTPKKFQSLHRAKKAIQEICSSKNQDWHHYVGTYGYFDQSHFCKEIKRYTSFTPTQLVKVPSFVTCRP